MAGLFLIGVVMLDVHILLHHSQPDWLEECRRSINAAVEAAGYPVAVHWLEGKDGHIGQGRAKGYALGIHPYVTCVDDDDYLLPCAFRNLREGIEGNHVAISTLELRLQNACFTKGRQRHHLIAYRRASLIDHAAWPSCGDVAQIESIRPDDWFDVERPGYVHRLYSHSAARRLRKENPGELTKACAHV